MKCCFCNEDILSNVSTHFRENHGNETQFVCMDPACKKIFKSVRNLIDHNSRMHEPPVPRKSPKRSWCDAGPSTDQPPAKSPVVVPPNENDENVSDTRPVLDKFEDIPEGDFDISAIEALFAEEEAASPSLLATSQADPPPVSQNELSSSQIEQLREEENQIKAKLAPCLQATDELIALVTGHMGEGSRSIRDIFRDQSSMKAIMSPFNAVMDTMNSLLDKRKQRLFNPYIHQFKKLQTVCRTEYLVMELIKKKIFMWILNLWTITFPFGFSSRRNR